MFSSLRRTATIILLGLLIISFAIWGIADVFRGFGSTTVAEIGSTRIGLQEFENTYRREIDNLSRRTGQPLTRDQALRVGLPGQLVSRLVTDATVTEAANRLRLAVSDEELVKLIQSDPVFQSAPGRFERSLFQRRLKENGWSEDQYIVVARKSAIRQQLVEAIAGPMPAPRVYVEAVNQYRNEERVVSYIRLDEAAVGAVEPPAPEVLAAFFEERKAAFKAPEYRKIVALAIDPAGIAKPQDVTDDDARAAYQHGEARFGEPEKRRVQQIPFDKREDAEAALAKLKAGTSFEDLMAERNLQAVDVDLGLLAKPAFLDPAIGEAAFQMGAVGETSGIVQGRFRTVILKLVEVQPARKKSFEEVKDQLKGEVAAERAETELLGLHDQIEDTRAGGAKLEEVAGRFKLKPIVIEAVDKTGKTPAGTAVEGLPEAARVIAAAFESDVGVENTTIQLPSRGFLWFDVVSIVPPRDRTLDEVRDDVIARWMAEQYRNRIAAKAAELLARIEKGESLEDVAASANLTVQTSPALKRGETPEGLSAAVVTAAFGGAEGHAATAIGDNNSRVVLQVKEVTEATFFGETETAKQTAQQISEDIQNTLFQQYVRRLTIEFPASVNQSLVTRAVGGPTPN